MEQCLCTVLNMCPVDDGQGAQLHPLLDQVSGAKTGVSCMAVVLVFLQIQLDIDCPL